MKQLDPRAAWLIAALALVSLPFFAVDFVPSMDLPQHVAQIRLLQEVWGWREATVEIHKLVARPWGTNTLVYWPLLALSQVCSPRLAGKLVLWLLVSASVLSFDLLARRRDRDPLAVLLASLTLFSTPLYAGYLNFLCGLPLFVIFLARSARPRENVPDALLLFAMVWANVLWLPAALVVEASWGWRPRRGLSFVPAALFAGSSVFALLAQRGETGFRMDAVYGSPWWQRLSYSFWAEATFGGLRGLVEPLALAGLLAYALFAWWRAQGDRQLAGLGLVFLLFALLAPDTYLNTMSFGVRFVPIGAALLLLSSPALELRLVRGLATLGAAAFMLCTTLAWALFDQEDLSGFAQSLRDHPDKRGTLSLDYRQQSRIIRGRPFMHLAAYRQAMFGGELGFTFAEHGSGIVSYRRPREIYWTLGIEWFPERANTSDLLAFPCALINRDPSTYGSVSADRDHFHLFCR